MLWHDIPPGLAQYARDNQERDLAVLAASQAAAKRIKTKTYQSGLTQEGPTLSLGQQKPT
jgi:hypothetical protein